MESYTILRDGRETYPVMIKAINSARHSILCANFCMVQGKVFQRFQTALIDAAERGVSVHLLLDAHGSKDTNPEDITALKQAGVRVVWFRPFKKLSPLQYNRRLHKKLLIVDDAIGFTGGIGVGDYWIANEHYPKPWRDTHFGFRGQIVEDMVDAFAQSWHEMSSIALPMEGKPAHLTEEITDITATNSPTFGYNNLSTVGELILGHINAAEKSLNLTTAYFGPSKLLLEAILAAAKRGVTVRLLVNGPYTNHTSAAEAGRDHYSELLNAGIEVYEYQPTKMHAKILTYDGAVSCIGSANLNYRSFYHDEEFNLTVRDAEFAKKLNRQFENDLKSAKRITKRGLRLLPRKTKLRRKFYRLGRYFY